MALLLGALPLTLLPAYAVLALGTVLRDRLLAVTGAGLVAAHLLVVAPAVVADPVPPAAYDAPVLRVVTANLYVLNPTPGEAAARLRELRPDVLVVPELDARGLAALRAAGLLDDLPHSVVPGGAAAETTGLFSRLPLADRDVRRYAARSLPTATLTVDGVPVRVLAAHPLPPLPSLGGLWRAALADLAASVRAQELPVVVAGDLNADRDHAAFRRLLATGLRDAHDSRGRGLARTWPAAFPLLHLDHVLVRDGAGARLVVTAVEEVELPGSDHLAVVAEVRVLRR